MIGFERLEQRTLLAADALAAIRLEIVDFEGQAVSRVEVGDEFLLRGIAEDLRDDRRGVFAAFADVRFDASLVELAAPGVVGSDFPVMRSGDFDSPGEFLGIGGARSLAAVKDLGSGGLSDNVFFQVSFQAISPGEVVFLSGPADKLPHYDVLLLGTNEYVDQALVDYGYARLQVGDPEHAPSSPWRNPGHPLDINDDGTVDETDAELIEAFIEAQGEVELALLDAGASTVPPYVSMFVDASRGVLSNDSSPSDSPLRAVLIAKNLDLPGRLDLHADGSFEYRPSLRFNEGGTFSYVAVSDEGTSDVRTVTIVGSHPPVVDVQVRAVNGDGEPLSSITIGREFFLQVVASSNRANGRELSASFNFSSRVVTPIAEVEFNPQFDKESFAVVKTDDGQLSLSSTRVPPTALVSDHSIAVNVPGYQSSKVLDRE